MMRKARSDRVDDGVGAAPSRAKDAQPDAALLRRDPRCAGPKLLSHVGSERKGWLMLVSHHLSGTCK